MDATRRYSALELQKNKLKKLQSMNYSSKAIATTHFLEFLCENFSSRIAWTSRKIDRFDNIIFVFGSDNSDKR
jgi:hypothetical protein